MDDRVRRLIEATKVLVTYIEEEQVFDKLSDAGCGYIDSYRSDAFEAVIVNARNALKEVENETQIPA